MNVPLHRFGVQPLQRAWPLSAMLSAILLAACGGGGGGGDGGGGGGGGGGTNPPAPTVTLTASPATLMTGGTITLSWSTTNASSCTASGDWSGSKAISGSQGITAAVAGATTFTLGCTGGGGTTSRSATVTVSAPPSPTLTLTANPGVVTVGSAFSLNWSTTNASSCTASGGWSGAKATAGSESFTAVVPGAITYTLACTGAGGSISQNATVTINALPQPTLTLTANPASVTAGGSFTLQWASTNVTSCTASDSWIGSKAISGNQGITAAASGTFTYTLACTGAGGSISRSATVTVTPAPAIGQPLILVTVMGFTPHVSVPELVSPDKSALVVVDVWNQSVTAPVTTATVSINGTTLPYFGSLMAYAGELNVGPGATITASVTVEGVAYVASTRQFDTYPSIQTPYENMSWTTSAANEIRWHGTPSRPGAQLLLRMLGPSAQQDWPSSSFVNPGIAATSYTVPAGALSAVDYVLLVGYADIAEFPGALPGSAFVLGGFDHRHVSARTAPAGGVTALNFKTQAPVSVGVNGTKQMAVEATVNCCIFSDWTTKATWSSSNPAILTVNGTGIVTGVAAGTANVIATANGISTSIPVRVYQPTPLPATPPTASTAFQVDHTHAGYLTLGTAPALPLTNRWTATFAGRVSYPIVANGRVHVLVERTTGGVLGTSVYALDVNTGVILWGPLDHSSFSRWAAHTYANGRLFVITASGLLRAIDSATGAVIWSVQMPGDMGYSAPPVAVNGLVYLSVNGQMFAVDQQDGALLWKASVANGMSSSPTLGSGGLYVSYACDAYRLDPFSGDTLWRHRGHCASGGGGTTTVLAGNRLLARVSVASGTHLFRNFNVSDGAIGGDFASTEMPAVAGGTAYFVTSGVLRAVNIATNATLWTYAADPNLHSAPIIIDGMVAVGSTTGAVHLIDATTGSSLWSGQAAAGVSYTSEGAGVVVPAGLGAGSGYLLVPGDNTLTGWKMIP